ncbi:MAG: class III extradiol dioxygenase family protein [Alphaproteobacteria bacterium]
MVGGIGTSHVPSIGGAYDRGATAEPDWKPLFYAYVPVKTWLQTLKPDVAIVIYNDHGGDFFFDKYPTFAIGAAEQYAIADEGMGVRPLPPIRGDLGLSHHLCESLIYNEFDLTVCQEMAVEHGFLVPMHLCFDHHPDWSVATVPFAVNVIRHPLPTARRCFRLGQAIRDAVDSYDRDIRVVILGTGGMSHQLHGTRFGYINEAFDHNFLEQIENDPEGLAEITHHQLMQEAGAEGIELIMWLVMRGALPERVRRIHRNYYGPMMTGMGLITFEPDQ